MKVYWNSRKKCWSLLVKGRVARSEKEVLLENCSFMVNERGRMRVINSGHKNVHAFVVGEEIPLDYDYIMNCNTFEHIRYNPFREAFFQFSETKLPIYGARRVYLDGYGQVYADIA